DRRRSRPTICSGRGGRRPTQQRLRPDQRSFVPRPAPRSGYSLGLFARRRHRPRRPVRYLEGGNLRGWFVRVVIIIRASAGRRRPRRRTRLESSENPVAGWIELDVFRVVSDVNPFHKVHSWRIENSDIGRVLIRGDQVPPVKGDADSTRGYIGGMNPADHLEGGQINNTDSSVFFAHISNVCRDSQVAHPKKYPRCQDDHNQGRQPYTGPPPTHHLSLVTHSLYPICSAASETGRQTEGEAARRTDGIAREEATEVNHIDDVGKVFAVRLEAHIHTFGLVKVRACRNVHLKRRQDAAAREIKPVNNLLPVDGGFPLPHTVQASPRQDIQSTTARPCHIEFRWQSKDVERLGSERGRERSCADPVNPGDGLMWE